MPRSGSTENDHDDDARHYSTERVAAVRFFTHSHKQDVSFVGGDAIGLPLMEYTVRVGDTLHFHWWTELHVGRPRAVSINGGPWLPYETDWPLGVIPAYGG